MHWNNIIMKLRIVLAGTILFACHILINYMQMFYLNTSGAGGALESCINTEISLGQLVSSSVNKTPPLRIMSLTKMPKNRKKINNG